MSSADADVLSIVTAVPGAIAYVAAPAAAVAAANSHAALAGGAAACPAAPAAVWARPRPATPFAAIYLQELGNISEQAQI